MESCLHPGSQEGRWDMEQGTQIIIIGMGGQSTSREVRGSLGLPPAGRKEVVGKPTGRG